MNKKALIALLGETDQAYTQNNTPELALKRGRVRLLLATISQQKQEALYLLKQAVVILETARYEFDEMPLSLYLDLSVMLAKVYLASHHHSGHLPYAIVCEQILKPLAHHNRNDIYETLADSAACQQKNALHRHWTKKAQEITLMVNEIRH